MSKSDEPNPFQPLGDPKTHEAAAKLRREMQEMFPPPPVASLSGAQLGASQREAQLAKLLAGAEASCPSCGKRVRAGIEKGEVVIRFVE